METWQQTNLVLPDGKGVIQVNICASPNEFDATAKRLNDLLYATIVPLSDQLHGRPLCVGANFSMSWKTSEGVIQEAKDTTSHVFSGTNPAEWRLRLDGYLPLLQSIETYKLAAKSACESSTVMQNGSDVLPAMNLSNGFIGVITISVLLNNGKNINKNISPFRIPCGKVLLDGKVLFVSKELLAVHSQYFSTLFYGNFKEKEMEVVPLPGLTRSVLSSILHMISTPGSIPQSGSLLFFQFRIWHYLMDAACELLEKANQYELLGFIAKCSKYLQSVKFEREGCFYSSAICGRMWLIRSLEAGSGRFRISIFIERCFLSSSCDYFFRNCCGCHYTHVRYGHHERH